MGAWAGGRRRHRGSAAGGGWLPVAWWPGPSLSSMPRPAAMTGPNAPSRHPRRPSGLYTHGDSTAP